MSREIEVLRRQNLQLTHAKSEIEATNRELIKRLASIEEQLHRVYGPASPAFVDRQAGSE